MAITDRNHGAHIVRNLIPVLKDLARHIEQTPANKDEMLKCIREASKGIEAILKEKPKPVNYTAPEGWDGY